MSQWEESSLDCVVDLSAPEAGGALSHLSRDRLMDHVESELLQITTPESMFQARTALPTDVIKRYLVDQEHFDVSRLVLDAGSLEDVNVCGEDVLGVASQDLLTSLLHSPLSKTVVFTRTSDDLVSLKETDARGTKAHPHTSCVHPVLV